jgi:hypothetical protein
MAAVTTEPGEVEQAQGELPLTPVQILDRAIAWVEDHGWCQRGREYQDGRVCTIDALCRGAGYSNFGSWVLPLDDSALIRAAIAVLDAIGVPGSVPAFSIPSWNDAPERTRTDVIAALSKARRECEDLEMP